MYFIYINKIQSKLISYGFFWHLMGVETASSLIVEKIWKGFFCIICLGGISAFCACCFLARGWC